MIARVTTKNVFEAIEKLGHDEDFAPSLDQPFEPTHFPAGSREKIEVLQLRVEMGQPLWHHDDNLEKFLRLPIDNKSGGELSESESLLSQLEVPHRQLKQQQGYRSSQGEKMARRRSGPQSEETRRGVNKNKQSEQEQATADVNRTPAERAGEKSDSRESHGQDAYQQGRDSKPDMSAAHEPTASAAHTKAAATGKSSHRHEGLRPPTKEELRLLASFKASVGSGITQTVLDGFISDLRADGVDISLAAK